MDAPTLGTKDKLIRAAMAITARDGLSAATTAAIAAEAGVAEGTLYRHFPGKDELMIAAYRTLKAAAAERFAATQDDAAGVDVRLKRLWRSLFDHYRADRTGFVFGQRFAESPLAAREGGVAAEALLDVFQAWRAQALEQGLVKNLPTDLMFALLIAPVSALLKQEIGGRAWRDEDLDAAADAVWDALRRQL